MSTKVFSPAGLEPDLGAIKQIEHCLSDERAVAGALMADHHLGYSMPIGGVVAYQDAISPSGVGFDIACGNKAVRTDLHELDLGDYTTQEDFAKTSSTYLKYLMREIQRRVAFGIGRTNDQRVDHPLFDQEIWKEISMAFGTGLRQKAQAQLGTVGSGNHYVDLLVDETGYVWIANHFGSRGLGHTLATGFMAKALGAEFTDRLPESEDPVVLDTKGLGQFYIEAMRLAGDYAYAGRDYVIDQVLQILGNPTVTMEVHNHHNFAWLENGLWVVRKGATPLTREPAFIGGSMGDISVIVKGTDLKGPCESVNCGSGDWTRVHDIGALGSAPHGAGRVMSRTAAAGKLRNMMVCSFCGNTHRRTEERGLDCSVCKKGVYQKRRLRDTSTAKIDWDTERGKLNEKGIVVLGAGADESPGVYKPLEDVLAAHSNIEIMHTLNPIGVVMAGPDEFDPYKD